MCEPTTIAYAVSAVAGAYGAYSSSQAAKGQAEYQSEVERNNAKIAAYQRDDAIMRGGEEANRLQREAERMRGAGQFKAKHAFRNRQEFLAFCGARAEAPLP